MKNKVLLVGLGRMGLEYGKVLKEMNIDLTAVGRGNSSAAVFTEKTGFNSHTGGIESWLDGKHEIPETAIVAVKVVDLYRVCKLLLEAGVKKILLEKPGAIYYDEIRKLNEIALSGKAEVFLAYNRRFLQSVLQATDILASDGGVSSFNFEFTELSDKVEVFQTDPDEKSRWFLSNSSHVCDLAFHLGGKPAELNTYKKGKLKWHDGASVFSGSGVSQKGALFSYSADWQAPGRWGVELMSENYRIILRPLEQLQVQKKGSFTIEQVELTGDRDKRFKPGVFRMLEIFLSDDTSGLCTLEEQAGIFDTYCNIAGYK